MQFQYKKIIFSPSGGRGHWNLKVAVRPTLHSHGNVLPVAPTQTRKHSLAWQDCRQTQGSQGTQTRKEEPLTKIPRPLAKSTDGLSSCVLRLSTAGPSPATTSL